MVKMVKKNYRLVNGINYLHFALIKPIIYNFLVRNIDSKQVNRKIK